MEKAGRIADTRSGSGAPQLCRAGGETHIQPQVDKRDRKSAVAVDVADSRTIVDSNIAPIRPSELRKALLERRDAQLRLWIALREPDAPPRPVPLRARRERSIGRATETTGRPQNAMRQAWADKSGSSAGGVGDAASRPDTGA
jgi:hypothetical protein